MSDDSVILVPLDGRTAALPVLSVAKVFSELERAPVRILHVTEQAALPAADLAHQLGLRTVELPGASIAKLYRKRLIVPRSWRTMKSTWRPSASVVLAMSGGHPPAPPRVPGSRG